MELAHSESANPHWTPRATKHAMASIPGEDGLPFLGATLEILRDPAAFSARMIAQYGSVYRVKSFGFDTIALSGAEANELVLFDRDKLFSSEQGWGPMLNLLFPRGLMLMDFDRHRVDRRALQVAFKPEPMKAYAQVLNEGALARIKGWAGQDLRFYPEIKQLTLELAATAFLGIPFGPDADKVNQAFVDMVQASIGVVRRPLPFTQMGRGVKGRQFLVDYFGPMVEERRRNENRQDMFSQFCRATRDDGSRLTEGEIVDHMNFLMMAAHDTITSSVTSMVWHLAREPEWQEKLRAEALSVAPAGQGLTYDDLGRMELTEMFFKEALRMVAPVPTIPRRALRDFTFEGFDIPAGAQVSVSPSYTHHMAEYWPEPERFDPLRFTAEEIKARHRFAWVPFGGGAHMCLGLHFAYMQMKIIMHHMLTHMRVEVEPGYEPDWQAWPIPKPKDGLKLRMVKLG
ncbi:cytochrome P450 [Novosphingopyxis baekryungensis]|uniref:cytochrome P450 n=1 Tax=Novosphingopyxis baekryungensis TaxID=279369 RepID=UPI0003B34F57|nr:cytochrome P450 [Novosphingopyxis baekryungensis]